ncbi:MAG: hypothetical protein OEV33_00925, partial [Armatimonadota bacterium]|nr:hypothetical protein [Armatimonadota bacterium]
MAMLTMLEVEGTTFEDARSKLQSQVGQDLVIVLEKLIGVESVIAIGQSEHEAYREAEAQVPKSAQIASRTLLEPPDSRVVLASASNSSTADADIRAKARPGETVRNFRVVDEPKPGFLGIGRKPGNYAADIHSPAKVAVGYVTKPAIHAWIGELRVKRLIAAVKDWYKESAGGQIGRACDDCNGKLVRGNTYLRPGNYLCCEPCTDTFLCSYVEWDKAVTNLNRAIGPGVPQHIQRLVDDLFPGLTREQHTSTDKVSKICPSC